MTPPTPNDQTTRDFIGIVWDHHRHHRRDLLWRKTDIPYRILVSEFMLQQTQVERVSARYGEFLDAFPDVASLAQAPLADVLRLWQGLGYNRRALSLKRAAEAIMERYGGVVPELPEELITLPGVGPYTAGAVAAFAFRRPVVFIETNIRRAFIHHFFPDREHVRDDELLPLVETTLDRENPREWYYALMDYGAAMKGTLPNANRRSAHYARQSRFEGSNRQIRGAVLRELTRGPMDDDELCAALDGDTRRVDSVLDALRDEGFIVLDEGTYRIA